MGEKTQLQCLKNTQTTNLEALKISKIFKPLIASSLILTFAISPSKAQSSSKQTQPHKDQPIKSGRELFFANFNSLNKRMGELRHNTHSQGMWERVFYGTQSSNIGLQTTTNYATAQIGYDYAFGFEGATNFMGLALSYTYAKVKPQVIFDTYQKEQEFQDSSSHGVEIALYNSYLGDGVKFGDLDSSNWFKGFYNDTIAKVSFISDSLPTSQQTQSYNTNNLGLSISDEFGYRFKFGDEGEWLLDPQFELGFGYLKSTQSKQNHSIQTQQNVFVLRNRAGINFAYDFKKFTSSKGVDAQIYLGTYYSYDLINGGEIDIIPNLGTSNSIAPFKSSGRFELNVGTNLEVRNDTRIYLDFEKSFGGKINTDYQINIGVRYSFGENTQYKPISKKIELRKIIAPIDLEDRIEEVKEEKATIEIEEVKEERIESVEAETRTQEVSKEKKKENRKIGQ